jgi:hypothetical protein
MVGSLKAIGEAAKPKKAIEENPMFRVFVLAVATSFVCSSASADHFNQRNIIDLCRSDTSLDSTCFTYLAAYRDLIGFLIFSSDEDRERVLCLSQVPTADIAQGVATASETDRSGQVADLLIAEFCP